MPFYQRSWVNEEEEAKNQDQVAKDVPKDVSKEPRGAKKVLRTIPLGVSRERMLQDSKTGNKEPTWITSEPPLKDRSRLMQSRTDILSPEEELTFIRAQLTKQVASYHALAECCTPVEYVDGHFDHYDIHHTEVRFKGIYSMMCAASWKDPARVGGANNKLVCRILAPSAMINPRDDPFLRILRHISSSSHSDQKSPHLATILDMFFDRTSGSIYLFTELAEGGNAMEWTRKPSNRLDERAMHRWAEQLHSALDFLGTKAVCHRDIYPKHLLLYSNTTDDGLDPSGYRLKLSGFRKAILYWDPIQQDIADQPCRPLSEATNFSAPEMFTDHFSNEDQAVEHYNPVLADIWSFGATMFYLASKRCPFDCPSQAADPQLELTIRGAIAELKTLSEAAKSWLWSLMNTNALERADWDQVGAHKWLYVSSLGWKCSPDSNGLRGKAHP